MGDSDRSPEVENAKTVWGNILKWNRNASIQNRYDKENSMDPHSGDDDYDRYHRFYHQQQRKILQ